MAKNLTLSLDEDQLSRLRVYAAQHRTTVNALFRKHANDLLGDNERREAARTRLIELSRQSAAYDEANPHAQGDHPATFSRDETYSGRRFEWPRDDR